MTRPQILIALALLAALSAVPLSAQISGDSPATTTLEVEIAGFTNDEGRLAIALFADADDFDERTNAVAEAFLEISDRRSRWRIDSLPVGEYALIAYHDVNDNETIDLGAFGIPQEPYGASGDARRPFGPPKYEDAKFEATLPLTLVEITVK